MDIKILIDKLIESIEGEQKAIVNLMPPQSLTGEFKQALECAKAAKRANGESAQALLAEAQFLYDYAKRRTIAWQKIRKQISELCA